MYRKYIKRAQDFLCALLAIIVLSPIMLITAILVRTKYIRKEDALCHIQTKK